MSKLNITIEYNEKNNAGKKNGNTIGPFHNVLHNLQYAANILSSLSVIPLLPIEYRIELD